MNPVQLPHEILLYISAFTGQSRSGSSGSSLLQQLLLYRPFYEYYTANRQYCIQLHTVVKTGDDRTLYTVFGKLHLEDGPAVILHDGTEQYWYLNDKLHRLDGPAIISVKIGRWWYLNDKLHRVGKPAITYPNGAQYWYLNGKLHREDGPAIILPDGFQDWYYHGENTGDRQRSLLEKF